MGWFIAGFVLVAMLFPLAIIWAVNTLFGLGIEFTFWNWLAVVILQTVFSPNVSVKK